MNLSLKNRLLILTVLPKTASFTDLMVRKGIIEKVEPTPEEIKKYGILSIEGAVTWQPTEDTFPIELSEVEKMLIRGQLKNLDDKKEATPDLLELWSVFN